VAQKVEAQRTEVQPYHVAVFALGIR